MATEEVTATVLELVEVASIPLDGVSSSSIQIPLSSLLECQDIEGKRVSDIDVNLSDMSFQQTANWNNLVQSTAPNDSSVGEILVKTRAVNVKQICESENDAMRDYQDRTEQSAFLEATELRKVILTSNQTSNVDSAIVPNSIQFSFESISDTPSSEISYFNDSGIQVEGEDQSQAIYQSVSLVPSGEIGTDGEVNYILVVSQPSLPTIVGPVNSQSETTLSSECLIQQQVSTPMSVFLNKNASPNLACSLCAYSTTSQTSMSQHMIAHRDNNEIEITSPSLNLTATFTPLGPQTLIPTGIYVSNIAEQQFACHICAYKTNKKSILSRHMKTHAIDRPWKCPVCEHAFKTMTSLSNHVNTHTGLRPHKCDSCESAFTTSGELVRHTRYRHTFDKPHKCSHCNYASVELSKLKRHIRSHTGEKPYECRQCEYASPDQYKLKRHMRVHTGDKPYACQFCPGRFTQSNSLKAHLLTHSKNRPAYQCEMCPVSCGRKSDLRIHVQKLHSRDKPVVCKRCDKSLPDRYTYKLHVRDHEHRSYKCQSCQYVTWTYRDLHKHLLTHTQECGPKTYTCFLCDERPVFATESDIRVHIARCHYEECTLHRDGDPDPDCEACSKMSLMGLLQCDHKVQRSTVGDVLCDPDILANIVKGGKIPQVMIVHPDGHLVQIHPPPQTDTHCTSEMPEIGDIQENREDGNLDGGTATPSLLESDEEIPDNSQSTPDTQEIDSELLT